MEWKNNFKRFRKRAAHRARIFVKYHLHRTEKDPVFVIATRRSGSNFLLSCLNSVPGVCFASELLHEQMFYGIRRRWISKKTILRHIAYSLNDCSGKLCGAKFLMRDMEYHGLTVQDLKTAFPTARFIILYRKSIVEQFVSLKIAEMTDVWLWNDRFRVPETVFVAEEELRNYARMIRSFYGKVFSCPGLDEYSLIVSYEDLAEDLQGFFNENIFPFLSVPFSEIVAGTKKQNTKELHDIIQNYGQIRPLLSEPLMNQEYSFNGLVPTKVGRCAEDLLFL